MGRKLTSVYTVLVEGMSSGLAGHELYRFVTESCDGFSHKRLCRAAILAMSDSRILDREALEGVYMIATHQKVTSALNLRH
jgi:hypothetical protein